MSEQSTVRRRGSVVRQLPERSKVPVGRVQVTLTEDRDQRLWTAARRHGTSIENIVQAAWVVLLDGLTGHGELDEAMSIRQVLTFVAGLGPPVQGVVRIEPGEIDAGVRPYRAGSRARPRRDLGRAGLEVCLTPAVTLRLSYPAAGFDRCAAEHLVDCLLRVLEVIVVAPDQPICRVEVLGDEERWCIRGRWAGLPASDRTVAELFEDRVDRMPEAVAVAFGEGTLSYAQLDRAANRLANELADHRTDASPPVLLDMPVSPDLVVGMLATLKAGATGLIAPARFDGRSRPSRVVVLAAVDGQPGAYPDTRPARAPAGSACLTVRGAAHDDPGVTVAHDALLDLLLLDLPERWSGAPPIRRPSAASLADLIDTVLLPLITGATLVVVPDAVAV